MRTILCPVMMLMACIVAGCGSATAERPSEVYDFVVPSDPLAHERAVDIEVGKCMTAAGLGYHLIEFPSDPVGSGAVDSRQRRQKFGFGISTGGPTPDDVYVDLAEPVSQTDAYNKALADCGQIAEDRVQAAQDARYASFTPAERQHLAAAETAPQIQAAWVRWTSCIGKAGVSTPSRNSAELRAELLAKYNAGGFDLPLFQLTEIHAAVVDWDCFQDVRKTVEEYIG